MRREDSDSSGSSSREEEHTDIFSGCTPSSLELVPISLKNYDRKTSIKREDEVQQFWCHFKAVGFNAGLMVM